MRCFAYIRVSTQKQKNEGVSLDAQTEAIERYARIHGLNIVRWFQESKTAAKQGRGEFNTMLRLLKKEKANGVILHKIDRGARNLRDWADLAELVDQGITIHLASESLDLSSRGGRLSADIQAVVAADYVRNLREETKKGFYGRLKQGLYPLYAPLGYVNNGGGQVKTIHPVMGPLVKELFTRYASGRYSMRRLMAEMNQKGLRNGRGKPLAVNSVAKVLHNPFYYGVMEIKTTGETFKGIHKPLITKSLFDRAQKVMTGRTRVKQHVHELVYRKLVRCAGCGTVLIGEIQKGHTYYRCHTKLCAMKCIREEAIAKAVKRQLGFVSLPEDELERARQFLEEKYASFLNNMDNEVDGLRLALGDTESRLSRLADLVIDGTFNETLFEEKRIALNNQKEAIEDQIRRIRDNPEEIFDTVSTSLELATNPLLSYQSGKTLEKRELVEETTSNRSAWRKEASIELQEQFSLIADRHLVSSCGPQRDVPRTLETTELNLNASLEKMIVRLWNWAKRVHSAGDGSIRHLPGG